jgi:hypothetical protein
MSNIEIEEIDISDLGAPTGEMLKREEASPDAKQGGYLYFPIATEELISEYAELWNDGRKQKGKSTYPVLGSLENGTSKMLRRIRGQGLLKDVLPGKKLYIVSHGTGDYKTVSKLANGERAPQRRETLAHDLAKRIGLPFGKIPTLKEAKGTPAPKRWNQDGTAIRRAYTPEALAKHMAAEGLNKNHTDIRLFSCGSGTSTGTEESFARRFYVAMHGLGYKKLVVYGYLGELRSAYSSKPVKGHPERMLPSEYKGVEREGGVRYRASDFRVKYGPPPNDL